jgi:ribosomal protein L32
MGTLGGLLSWFSTEEDTNAYECLNCGAGYRRRRQVCPACGGYRIERREW